MNKWKKRYAFLLLLFVLFALCLPCGFLSAQAEEARAGVASASCSVQCWEGEGVENLVDGDDGTYMNPVTKTYTIKIELDGYYRLTGFRWYALEGFYPYGDLSVSLNGGSFTKWTEFAFTGENLLNDPVYGKGYLMTYAGEAYAKYILINVTGGKEEAVATREFTVYGSPYTPDRVDPEGISIAEKNADGAYNSEETACGSGDTFLLTAVQKNPASIEKVVWESKNTVMISVDEFGRVTIHRGGVQPYYTVSAKVTAPGGKEYSDEIKIFVKPVANIATAGTLTYSDVGYYWRPQMAFDGIASVFGNWVQPVAGVSEYQMTCTFDQEIEFGKICVYVGVNAPKEIAVLGQKEDGSFELVHTFTNVAPQGVLTLENAGRYFGFRFAITEKSGGMSTIYEIEIYNHESFPLSEIKQSAPPDGNRGPGASGKYEPEKLTGERASGSYGEKFTRTPAKGVFAYTNKPDPLATALIVITCVLGALAIGAGVYLGLIIHKKRK